MVRDSARYWRHPVLGGLDMLHARYVRHAWGWHSHATYAIGALHTGEEEIDFPEGPRRVRPGEVLVIPPDVAHTGRPGQSDGWAYRVFYPSVDQLRAIAGDLPDADGARVLCDPDLADALLTAHREAEHGDPLTADTGVYLVLRWLAGAYDTGQRLTRRSRQHGRERAGSRHAPSPVAHRARDLLASDLTGAPTLNELASTVDCTPFGLLREFRRAYGMPPHAYLTHLRVIRARQLLETGEPPADVALLVGFCDQSHLTRHFRRLVGVPPGAYQRAVQERPRNTLGE